MNPKSEVKAKFPFKRPKPKPKPVQMDPPMFLYTSMCCSGLATKTPCVKVATKEAGQQGMGGWRCPTCSKPCKVSRTRNKQETTIPGAFLDSTGNLIASGTIIGTDSGPLIVSA